MKPTFPLRIEFDDGDVWTLATSEEVACNLEWFDTEDGDDSARVHDATGKSVRLKVEAFEVLILELK